MLTVTPCGPFFAAAQASESPCVSQASGASGANFERSASPRALTDAHGLMCVDFIARLSRVRSLYRSGGSGSGSDGHLEGAWVTQPGNAGLDALFGQPFAARQCADGSVTALWYAQEEDRLLDVVALKKGALAALSWTAPAGRGVPPVQGPSSVSHGHGQRDAASGNGGAADGSGVAGTLASPPAAAAVPMQYVAEELDVAGHALTAYHLSWTGHASAGRSSTGSDSNSESDSDCATRVLVARGERSEASQLAYADPRLQHADAHAMLALGYEATRTLDVGAPLRKGSGSGHYQRAVLRSASVRSYHGLQTDAALHRDHQGSVAASAVLEGSHSVRPGGSNAEAAADRLTSQLSALSFASTLQLTLLAEGPGAAGGSALALPVHLVSDSIVAPARHIVLPHRRPDTDDAADDDRHDVSSGRDKAAEKARALTVLMQPSAALLSAGLLSSPLDPTVCPPGEGDLAAVSHSAAACVLLSALRCLPASASASVAASKADADATATCLAEFSVATQREPALLTGAAFLLAADPCTTAAPLLAAAPHSDVLAVGLALCDADAQFIRSAQSMATAGQAEDAREDAHAHGHVLTPALATLLTRILVSQSSRVRPLQGLLASWLRAPLTTAFPAVVPETVLDSLSFCDAPGNELVAAAADVAAAAAASARTTTSPSGQGRALALHEDGLRERALTAAADAARRAADFAAGLRPDSLEVLRAAEVAAGDVGSFPVPASVAAMRTGSRRAASGASASTSRIGQAPFYEPYDREAAERRILSLAESELASAVTADEASAALLLEAADRARSLWSRMDAWERSSWVGAAMGMPERAAAALRDDLVETLEAQAARRRQLAGGGSTADDGSKSGSESASSDERDGAVSAVDGLGIAALTDAIVDDWHQRALIASEGQHHDDGSHARESETEDFPAKARALVAAIVSSIAPHERRRLSVAAGAKASAPVAADALSWRDINGDAGRSLASILDAVGALGSPAALPLILNYTLHRSPMVRDAALSALHHQAIDAAVPAKLQGRRVLSERLVHTAAAASATGSPATEAAASSTVVDVGLHLPVHSRSLLSLPHVVQGLGAASTVQDHLLDIVDSHPDPRTRLAAATALARSRGSLSPSGTMRALAIFAHRARALRAGTLHVASMVPAPPLEEQEASLHQHGGVEAGHSASLPLLPAAEAAVTACMRQHPSCDHMNGHRCRELCAATTASEHKTLLALLGAVRRTPEYAEAERLEKEKDKAAKASTSSATTDAAAHRTGASFAASRTRVLQAVVSSVSGNDGSAAIPLLRSSAAQLLLPLATAAESNAEPARHLRASTAAGTLSPELGHAGMLRRLLAPAIRAHAASQRANADADDANAAGGRKLRVTSGRSIDLQAAVSQGVSFQYGASICGSHFTASVFASMRLHMDVWGGDMSASISSSGSMSASLFFRRSDVIRATAELGASWPFVEPFPPDTASHVAEMDTAAMTAPDTLGRVQGRVLQSWMPLVASIAHRLSPVIQWFDVALSRLTGALPSMDSAIAVATAAEKMRTSLFDAAGQLPRLGFYESRIRGFYAASPAANGAALAPTVVDSLTANARSISVQVGGSPAMLRPSADVAVAGRDSLADPRLSDAMAAVLAAHAPAEAALQAAAALSSVPDGAVTAESAAAAAAAGTEATTLTAFARNYGVADGASGEGYTSPFATLAAQLGTAATAFADGANAALASGPISRSSDAAAAVARTLRLLTQLNSSLVTFTTAARRVWTTPPTSAVGIPLSGAAALQQLRRVNASLSPIRALGAARVDAAPAGAGAVMDRLAAAVSPAGTAALASARTAAAPVLAASSASIQRTMSALGALVRAAEAATALTSSSGVAAAALMAAADVTSRTSAVRVIDAAAAATLQLQETVLGGLTTELARGSVAVPTAAAAASASADAVLASVLATVDAAMGRWYAAMDAFAAQVAAKDAFMATLEDDARQLVAVLPMVQDEPWGQQVASLAKDTLDALATTRNFGVANAAIQQALDFAKSDVLDAALHLRNASVRVNSTVATALTDALGATQSQLGGLISAAQAGPRQLFPRLQKLASVMMSAQFLAAANGTALAALRAAAASANASLASVLQAVDSAAATLTAPAITSPEWDTLTTAADSVAPAVAAVRGIERRWHAPVRQAASFLSGYSTTLDAATAAAAPGGALPTALASMAGITACSLGTVDKAYSPACRTALQAVLPAVLDLAARAQSLAAAGRAAADAGVAALFQTALPADLTAANILLPNLPALWTAARSVTTSLANAPASPIGIIRSFVAQRGVGELTTRSEAARSRLATVNAAAGRVGGPGAALAAAADAVATAGAAVPNFISRLSSRTGFIDTFAGSLRNAINAAPSLALATADAVAAATTGRAFQLRLWSFEGGSRDYLASYARTRDALERYRHVLDNLNVTVAAASRLWHVADTQGLEETDLPPVASLPYCDSVTCVRPLARASATYRGAMWKDKYVAFSDGAMAMAAHPLTSGNARWLLPGAFEDWVPRGFALFYRPNLHIIALHGFGRREHDATLLAFLRVSDGAIVKLLRLHTAPGAPFRGSAAGIAVTAGYIWVSDDSEGPQGGPRATTIVAFSRADIDAALNAADQRPRDLVAATVGSSGRRAVVDAGLVGSGLTFAAGSDAGADCLYVLETYRPARSGQKELSVRTPPSGITGMSGAAVCLRTDVNGMLKPANASAATFEPGVEQPLRGHTAYVGPNVRGFVPQYTQVGASFAFAALMRCDVQPDYGCRTEWHQMRLRAGSNDWHFRHGSPDDPSATTSGVVKLPPMATGLVMYKPPAGAGAASAEPMFGVVFTGGSTSVQHLARRMNLDVDDSAYVLRAPQAMKLSNYIVTRNYVQFSTMGGGNERRCLLTINGGGCGRRRALYSEAASEPNRLTVHAAAAQAAASRARSLLDRTGATQSGKSFSSAASAASSTTAEQYAALYGTAADYSDGSSSFARSLMADDVGVTQSAIHTCYSRHEVLWHKSTTVFNFHHTIPIYGFVSLYLHVGAGLEAHLMLRGDFCPFQKRMSVGLIPNGAVFAVLEAGLDIFIARAGLGIRVTIASTTLIPLAKIESTAAAGTQPCMDISAANRAISVRFYFWYDLRICIGWKKIKIFGATIRIP